MELFDIIDYLPLGDGGDIDDEMPLGDEEDAFLTLPEGDDVDPEPEPVIQESGPVAPVPPVQEPETILEPDPNLPWIERTRARINAISRSQEGKEAVVQREIDEIIKNLEGGGVLYSLGTYMDRLKKGEYTDSTRAARSIQFYFSYTFAALDYKALCDDHDMAVMLWREYSRFIPPARWREYIDKINSNPAYPVCIETFFKSMHDTYLHYLWPEIRKRETEWEAAVLAAGKVSHYAHKAAESADGLHQGDVYAAAECRKKVDELEARTVYGWRDAMSHCAFMYSFLIDVDYNTDGMHREYRAACDDFYAKLKEHKEEIKR